MSNSRYKNIYLLKPYCLSILLIIACAISVGAKTTTSTSNGFTVTATDNVTLNGQTGILFKIKVIVPGPDTATEILTTSAKRRNIHVRHSQERHIQYICVCLSFLFSEYLL